MLDLRTYRDQETTWAHFADGAHTMLGQEQFEWLRGQVTTSNTQWNVLANSVMMAPMKLFTLGSAETREALSWISERSTGIAVNSDQWDGYVADRNKLLDVLLTHGVNVLFLTGDIHSEWANEINHGVLNVGCELVCTSIGAPNVDEILTKCTGIYHPEDNSTSHTVESVITGANPWVKHLDFDAHGYSIARVRPNEVEMEYYRVGDVEEQNSPTRLAVVKTWRAGEGFVR
ncbi:alkaline phosphatase D family protein [Corynebacterium cystitidis]|uniref:alkaline phosphatase D family protein n=1 Tax=Corynebacterium cystitidis TaxID=35757 RepID=UPI0028120319|nr:alkaline phosphatase D family protein [Corynebacterium cystitidis]